MKEHPEVIIIGAGENGKLRTAIEEVAKDSKVLIISSIEDMEDANKLKAYISEAGEFPIINPMPAFEYTRPPKDCHPDKQRFGTEQKKFRKQNNRKKKSRR